MQPTLNMETNLSASLATAGDTRYDVIIVGGGPGGASAAIYTARADLRTLVIDKGLTAGALGITTKISNYPGVPGTVSGADLVKVMRRQAESFGAHFITDRVIGLDFQSSPKAVWAGTSVFQAPAVILATGAMGRSSTVPGEERLLGRGVSYCATCDGAFFRDRVVAVVGNNDEAFEEAHFLTKFVARVHLIMPSPTPKAQAALVNRIKTDPKITLRPATRLKEVLGNGVVEGVRIHPRSGRPETIPVSGAFIYLQGGRPITDYFLGQLQTRPEGCLDVDDEMQTSIRGVYAVGDLLCNHVKQAVIAAAGGATAAIAADKYVHGRSRLQTDWG
ncbi:MAG TPA: FAD-dependent oxidoreductase [Candidatus Binatia bacterium]|nr:FAD-dependent oxidoreductase [Candidatus Binatia bacterium]